MEEYINLEKEKWGDVFKRPVIDNSSLEEDVKIIIDDVIKDGDKAVKKYVKKFDGAELSSLQISSDDIYRAQDKLSEELKSSIEKAAFNIEKFHVSQFNPITKIETAKNVWCWQKSVGIEKVGLYIPGGSAPLFSTVLMLGIPAKIAGCKDIILCTPTNSSGEIHPAVLCAAKIIGISKIYKIGGVQAIAAMAYGTESIPQVYKIFGPGNQYVTCAKQIVSRTKCAIDIPAGPSEVAVIADAEANPEFVAADLISQAEHGVDSQSLLFTNSKNLSIKVQNAVERQLNEINRKEIAAKSIENSKVLFFDDMETIIDAVNNYAPEHLILLTNNYKDIAGKIINAGSVFMGSYTPESAGDYASGTNHTLPTNGWAVSYSAVNLDSFVKKITFQEISKEGIEELGKVIVEMAKAEGLDAHAKAAELRMK